MAQLSDKILEKVIMQPSIFNKEEFTVVKLDTGETLGTVTVSKAGHLAHSALANNKVSFGSMKFAVYFLLNSKKEKSKVIKMIPGQKMLIDLLS
ncbi:MAG: hypothetical protein KAY50_00720 [Chitinophagaceae bacterium]|nr:hypothetical protein [Chitinophagaceae bacterium]